MIDEILTGGGAASEFRPAKAGDQVSSILLTWAAPVGAVHPRAARDGVAKAVLEKLKEESEETPGNATLQIFLSPVLPIQ